MAFSSCPLLATSLLLCSRLVVASANDYSYDDSSKNQAYRYGTKPEGEEKNNYETKPSPKGEEKPQYGTKPDLYQPQTAYVTKPPANQPRPEKPVSEKEEKPDYGTKPNLYKQQPEDKEKSMPEETEKPGYSTKPVYQPQPEKEEKPDYSTENNFYKPQPEEFEKPESQVLPIGVQGLVLCKSGPKYYPIQGALARITCLAVDENGHEKPHSVCSGETDAKGYFFARLSPSGVDNVDDHLSKLTDCKAFLESSPLETCNVPVDVNKGISGAALSDFRVLNQKKIKLYSVGPFFFTSEPNSVPNGYKTA